MQPTEPTTPNLNEPSTTSPPEPTPAAETPLTQPTVSQAPVSAGIVPAQSVVTGSSLAKPRKRFSLALVAVLVLALVGGGGAAAYYGVIVPNKPENVLRTAVANTLQQKKTKFDAKLTYESTEKSAMVKAVNVTMNGQADMDAKAFQANVEVTASGATVPLEVRSLDKTVYLKFGSLKSLSGLVRTGSPEYAVYIDSIGKKVENQWMSIDETLMKQTGSQCALDASYGLTPEDIELIMDQYSKTPFATVRSQTAETLNGRNTLKYVVDLDGKKAAEYGKSLSELSFVKKLKECENTADTTKVEDSEDGTVTIWVDKATKTVAKLATTSSPAQEAKEKAKASFEITMQYGQAEVSKPEGARPIMEVFGDLEGVLGARDALNPAVLGASTGR